MSTAHELMRPRDGRRPLAGKRILITRAAHQAGRLQEALEARGAEVLSLPTIAIEPPISYAPLDAALAALGSFSWLILTSANSARVLGERMQALNIVSSDWARIRVACVGPSTARAARELGLQVALVPERYVAEDLVESLRSLPEKLAGQKVLLVRAAVARDAIPEALREMGVEVVIAEAYRTVVPAGAIDGIRALLAPDAPWIDAATFTSSSTVTNFFTLLHAAKVELPSGLRAISIGPVTSRTLREHGWAPAGEAASSDLAGLAAACERLLAG